ncbi:MAG: hypothetical protein MJA28_05800 [Gammaproteobacteria bacterium]|nr:hypothetical protein [Gammaproteobacteria bacterium]
MTTTSKALERNKSSVNTDKYLDFVTVEKANLAEIHAGFSERLNWLLDASDMNPPPLDAGRVTWLAELTSSSRPATMDWLKHDRPPKGVTLRKLVSFINGHLPPIMSSTPKIEAWLKYGPDVVDKTYT